MPFVGHRTLRAELMRKSSDGDLVAANVYRGNQYRQKACYGLVR